MYVSALPLRKHKTIGERMNSQQRTIWYANLGRTRYHEVWELQKKLHDIVAAEKPASLRFTPSGIEDVLIINEHEPVYTLGKSGDKNHLLANELELEKNKVDFFEIDRGGDITYHGPGQIVGYPILNLEHFRKDIHFYLRQLEEVIIRTLRHFKITGHRSDGETGVWVNNDKIAAIGIKVSRWTTMHGFAFNVNTDLTYFSRIIPCGIFHKGVTSMTEVLSNNISIDNVTPVLLDEFSNIFGAQLKQISPEYLTSYVKDYTTESHLVSESAN